MAYEVPMAGYDNPLFKQIPFAKDVGEVQCAIANVYNGLADDVVTPAQVVVTQDEHGYTWSATIQGAQSEKYAAAAIGQVQGDFLLRRPKG
jgi:hypothetical protein